MRQKFRTDLTWFEICLIASEKKKDMLVLRYIIFTVLVAGHLLNCLGKSKWLQRGCMDTCVCRKDVGWLLTSLRFLRCKRAGSGSSHDSEWFLQIGNWFFYWFIEVCFSSAFFFGQFCLLGCRTSHLPGDAFRCGRGHRAFANFFGNKVIQVSVAGSKTSVKHIIS